MKKKLVSMILCVAMVATMAVGCGSGAKNSGSSNNDKVADATTEVSDALVEEMKSMVPDGDYSKYTIGFCGMTLNNEYHIIVANAVQQACNALGIKCEIQAGSQHASVEEQLTIINY